MVFKERVEEANRIASQEIKALENQGAKVQYDSDHDKAGKRNGKSQNQQSTFKNKRVKYDI